MKKLITYSKYFYEYLKFGDFGSLLASVMYLINKTSHPNDRTIKTSVGTFFCRKNTNDFQFANYYYEWGVKKYFLHHRKEYSVFIDSGACIGIYSILLSKFGIRCLAFEPIGNTYDALVKNLELNGLLGKVKTYPFGFGDRNTQSRFVFDPVNTGASHIADPGQEGNCTVELRTFDSIYPSLGLNNNDNVFFKLDVEGMEPVVLRGAENFIRSFPNITFVMEAKHSGADTIKDTLNSFARFEYGIVDEYNIYAKKIN